EARTRDRSGRHQGGDRVPFLAEIDPLVPEGCPFLDSRRSPEGFLQGVWGGNIARFHESQGLGGRDARDGARSFWLAAFRGSFRAPGRLSDRAVRAGQSGEIRNPCL